MKFFFDLGFELMLKQIISIGFCSSSAHEFVLEQTRTKKTFPGKPKRLLTNVILSKSVHTIVIL